MKEKRLREPRRAVAGGLLEVGGYLHALRALGGVHPPSTSNLPFPSKNWPFAREKTCDSSNMVKFTLK